MNGQYHIVIAGGGFGGVRAALELSKLLPSGSITLINNTSYHVYHPDLYELAGTVLQKENKISFKNVEGTVNIPLGKIFQGKNIKVVVDEVESINLPEKYLMIKDGGTVNFDYLILTLGSTTNFFNTKGAENFSHQFKTAEDALNVRNDIEERVLSSDDPISIVIAGGGFTGTELAGSLVWFTRKLAKKYHKPGALIFVLEGSESVLGGMPMWAQKKALRRLEKLGVGVMLKHQISLVTKNEVLCDDGKSLAYDCLIWATGVKGANLNGKIKGVEFNPKGQIKAAQDLSLKEYPNTFVIGDLTECLDPKRQCPVASTAWAAISQARTAAKNVARQIKGQKLVDFIPPTPAFVVPVGAMFALSDLGSFKISGVLGWIIKRLISLKYLLSVLPFTQAVIIWFKGVRVYTNNES